MRERNSHFMPEAKRPLPRRYDYDVGAKGVRGGEEEEKKEREKSTKICAHLSVCPRLFFLAKVKITLRFSLLDGEREWSILIAP